MKIALIAPSPVPFEMGGAEKLWLGLQTQINNLTPHRCELIKIPTRERSFWELIAAYHQFYQTDLSHFDLVISGKYPAWMVRHPNHHIYMLHCLRGLYDTYHLMRLPWEVSSPHPKIQELLKTLDHERTEIPEVFERVYSLKEDSSISGDIFNFPGPLIRRVCQFLDRKAMMSARSFAAISRTVALRKDYFPPGAAVRVVYPASSLGDFQTGPYDYFFTASRLDQAKRVDLLVRAYRKAKINIPLKIAGTGPLEEELRAIAAKDPRIILLGYVSDQDLIDYYRKARAVIFIPYREDYGFITIEAMKCAKPVITFEDSGGVNEFVEHEKTGWVSKASVSGLKEVIETVSRQPEQVLMEMGIKAQKKVAFISWEYTVRNLVGGGNASPKAGKCKKITVLSTYPIYPPKGGGQNRLFYLFREVAKNIRVEVVCLGNVNTRSSRREIAPGLWETVVPKSLAHTAKEWAMERKAGIPITDIAMLFYHEKTPAYTEAVRKALEDSDFAVCAQPYTYPLLKGWDERRVIHDSQNCEYLLKKQMLQDNGFTQEILQGVYAVEKTACLHSYLSVVCSQEDGLQMQNLYSLAGEKIIEVPNGVDLQSVHFTNADERLENKKMLGLDNRFVALFMGSWHQPNIEAVEKIVKMAELNYDMKFLLVGSVGLYFREKDLPDNVGIMGVLEDGEKNLVLSIADVALNPMISGSGTNLKMLDYLAAGIPVISTEVGARGLKLPEGLVRIVDISEMGSLLRQYVGSQNIVYARKFVEENYDWRKIANIYAEVFNRPGNLP